MNIRPIQLTLFGDPAPVMMGGVPTCSLDHEKPKKAKYRVYFNNGHFRDVCGWCVKQFRDGGSSARLVERIEKLNKSKYGQW